MRQVLKLVALWSTILLCLAEPRQAAERSESSERVLVMYAFSAEGTCLEDVMTVDSSGVELGRKVVFGILENVPVILAESGMGMTNAAMSAQCLIDRHKPDLVLFSGIAGAIDTSVQIGDIVIPGEWIAHDYGYIGRDGFRNDSLLVYSTAADSIVPLSRFSVDSTLLALAKEVSQSPPELKKIGGRTPHVRVGGTGISGNVFVDNKHTRVLLAESFSALITDMESQAVAQVCLANGIPYLAIRSASDLAGGSGSDTALDQLRMFLEVAAENSGRVVRAFLRRLK
jgi:adenosylhomocysteine nucleosidase